MAYPDQVREGALEFVRSGGSARGAARRLGVSLGIVCKWCRRAGIPLGRDRRGGPVRRPDTPVERPAEGTGPRERLGPGRRCVIEARLRDGRSLREIARETGVAHATVAREVARDRGPDGACRARAAQRRADEAAGRPRATKLGRSARLRAEVARTPSLRWSPRQVSATPALEHPDDPEMQVGHETICQAPYVQGRGSLRQELRVEQALRSGRRSRRPRSRLPERRGRKTWVEGCEISLRPAGAEDRAVPGHWEGDLVVGPGTACLVTLVERSTRLLIARRLDARDSRSVVAC